jgi:hypothetical protein
LVSCLSASTTTRIAWFLDSGASRHMTKAWEIFSSLTERDSNLHLQCGDDSKYAMKGEEPIMFYLESRGSLNSQDVLYVLGLKKNFLSVSTMEDKDFFVTFQRGKVLIRP